MFCPPGYKKRMAGRLSRRQLKMQVHGMEKATGLEWNSGVGDYCSSDDDDLNFAIPDDVGPATKIGTEINVTRHEENLVTSESPSFCVNSANVISPSPNAAATSESSESDDDNENLMDACPIEGGTAVSEQVELNFLLNQLLLVTPNQDSSINNFNNVVPSADPSETIFATNLLDCTTDPTETETNLDEEDDDDAHVFGDYTRVHSGTVPPIDADAFSVDDSTIDNASDDDSLDLGVSTTVWSSQEKNIFSPNVTNKDAKREIAKMFTLPNADLNAEFDLELVKGDVNESFNTVDEEPLEANNVFLLTESNRYAGNQGTVTNNELFTVQEARYQTYAASLSKNNEHFALDCALDKLSLSFTDEIFDAAAENDDSPTNLNAAQENDMSGAQLQCKTTVGDCFGGIQLLTPTFFDGCEKTIVPDATTATSSLDIMSPLSSMVHHIDLDLFDDQQEQAPTKNRNASITESDALEAESRAVKGVRNSILRSEQITVDNENRRTNISSSFRSSSKSNRVAYSLSSGKKSMTKIQRVYSVSFLPRRRLSTSPQESIPASIDTVTRPGSLSVLLVNMARKNFEIVPCDVNRETTVGDVLSKARSMATDSALSEQKYVSFCYGDQEFGAPMLPVHVLIDWEKHKTRPLVVAVPMGSTAAEMQSVKRVLWKNPKLKEWWNQEDPFQPPMKTENTQRRSSSESRENRVDI